MYYFHIIKYLFFYKIIFLIRKFFFKEKIIINNSKKFIIEKHLSLLKKNGFSIIENYLDKNECENIIKDMNDFYKKNISLIWTDKTNSEYRIHGAENVSKKIKDFFSDKMLSLIGSSIFNGKMDNLMTMANGIMFKNENVGSGGGWHRDGIEFQYKSILYLVDTNKDNGAFQLIDESNKFWVVIKDSIKNKINIFNTRFSEQIVNEIIKNKPDRLKTLEGKAGTLILVDTSAIHRGSPLKKGSRYALTNYYYPSYKIDSMKNHFTPKVNNIYY
jgi:hypothetical protein